MTVKAIEILMGLFLALMSGDGVDYISAQRMVVRCEQNICLKTQAVPNEDAVGGRVKWMEVTDARGNWITGGHTFEDGSYRMDLPDTVEGDDLQVYGVVNPEDGGVGSFTTFGICDHDGQYWVCDDRLDLASGQNGGYPIWK